MCVFMCVQSFMVFFRGVARQLGMLASVPLGGTRGNSGGVAVRTLWLSKGCAVTPKLLLYPQGCRLHAQDAYYTQHAPVISHS